MKMFKKAAIFALILALFAVIAAGCAKNPADDTDSGEPEVYDNLSEGDSAPDFTAETIGGGEFKLSDKSDKVVILNFWATWCSPCVGEMPAFQRLYEEYGDTLAVLAVNCMEDKESADKLASDNGYTFPIAYDEEGDICCKYPSDGIPYTVIIGTDGKVAVTQVGAGDADTMYAHYSELIDGLLEE